MSPAAASVYLVVAFLALPLCCQASGLFDFTVYSGSSCDVDTSCSAMFNVSVAFPPGYIAKENWTARTEIAQEGNAVVTLLEETFGGINTEWVFQETPPQCEDVYFTPPGAAPDDYMAWESAVACYDDELQTYTLVFTVMVSCKSMLLHLLPGGPIAAWPECLSLNLLAAQNQILLSFYAAQEQEGSWLSRASNISIGYSEVPVGDDLKWFYGRMTGDGTRQLFRLGGIFPLTSDGEQYETESVMMLGSPSVLYFVENITDPENYEDGSILAMRFVHELYSNATTDILLSSLSQGINHMAFYNGASWGDPPYLPTDPKEYGEGGGMLTKAAPVISTWDGVFEGQNRTVTVVSVAPGKAAVLIEGAQPPNQVYSDIDIEALSADELNGESSEDASSFGRRLLQVQQGSDAVSSSRDPFFSQPFARKAAVQPSQACEDLGKTADACKQDPVYNKRYGVEKTVGVDRDWWKGDKPSGSLAETTPWPQDDDGVLRLPDCEKWAEVTSQKANKLFNKRIGANTGSITVKEGCTMAYGAHKKICEKVVPVVGAAAALVLSRPEVEAVILLDPTWVAKILALGAGAAIAGSLYCDHLDNVMASKCMFIEEWSNADKLTERCQIKENLCDEAIDKYNVDCKEEEKDKPKPIPPTTRPSETAPGVADYEELGDDEADFNGDGNVDACEWVRYFMESVPWAGGRSTAWADYVEICRVAVEEGVLPSCTNLENISEEDCMACCPAR